MRVLKIRLRKEEGKDWTVIVQRTRRKEGHTRMRNRVRQEDLDATIKELVGMVAPDVEYKEGDLVRTSP